jgi:U6 snRNA-associated Sm-like protein LSm7
VGVLKGYDQLLNLVLDEAVEFLRGVREKARRGRLQPTSPPHHAHPPSLPFSDKDDLLRVTDATRPLGLCVLRGTAVMAVAPTAGAERLAANPFAGAEEAG